MPDDTTVYTISAGMLPTVGFAREDFEADRVGEWRRDRARGSSLGIRGVIGSDGSLRKARIRGSVAWFEFSTTVKAIQNEVLEGVSSDVLRQTHQDWEAMARTGSQELYDDFIRRMGLQGMAPTGEHVQEGAMPGEQPTEQPAHWAAGKEGHKSDADMKAAGELVGKAKSIDLYFKGKDDKIYRVDVTSQTMDSKTHHGLTSKADRERAGVTSSQILEMLQGPDGFARAEAQLLTYFQKTQEGWNDVIVRLKSHLKSAGTKTASSTLLLKRLEAGKATLNDPNVISRLQSELKKGDKQNFLHQLRGTKRQSIMRMRKDASNRLGTGGKAEAFKSAVTFAIHMLGNIITLFAEDSKVKGGYSTEFRLGTSDAARQYTIEVKHVITASGKQVLEFQSLKKGDVLLHREAALQHVYMRESLKMERGGQNAILDRTSEVQSEMYASLGMMHDGAGVEIGGATWTVQSGLARDGNNVYQRARTVITPRRFNSDIENWIATTNVRGDWIQNVDNILRSHIRQYGNVEPQTEQLGRGNQGQYTQWASPINADNLNDWHMLAEGGAGHHGLHAMYNADPAEDPILLSRWRRHDSGMREDLYGPQLIPAEMSHNAVRHMHGSPDYHRQIANRRLEAAMTGNPSASASSLADSRAAYENLVRFRGSDVMDERGLGLGLGRGLLSGARAGPRGRQRKGKFWGLDEYLSRDTQDGFNDSVNASWWAAPYISLLFPSGQVSPAT